MWVDNQHTKFTLGRFAKDKKVLADSKNFDVSNVDKDEDTTQASALSARHIVGYHYGGQRPHSEFEHVANPNAVVIRGPHGIEVLSLLSGQPITRLELVDTRHIYLDVDGDGYMEQLVWDLGKVCSDS